MKQHNYHIKRSLLSGLLICLTTFYSCTKFVEVDPPFTSTSTEQVYEKDATAAASLTALYMQMSHSDVVPGNGIMSMSIDLGLYADELDYMPPINNTSYLLWTNQLTPADLAGGDGSDWGLIYNRIYEVNAAIEGLTAATKLSPAVKQQLLGEAKFMRGFFYFYLVNLFGDVPLVLSTDYKVNSGLHRATQENVYNQIINDLQDAEGLLRADYLSGDVKSAVTERVRPCKATAEALLARVYLYRKDYAEAETYASKVIDNISAYGLEPLDGVFLNNSREAIWQIPSVNNDVFANTAEGRIFILSSTTNTNTGPEYTCSSMLLNSFETGDLRKDKWIGYGVALNNSEIYFPYKYKIGFDPEPPTEYSMVFRLAEQYLIRAESRAMQSNVNGSQADLNVIRNRANLPNTTASSTDELINAIMQERRAELFTEWGHRYLDLKRLGQLDAILGTEKPQFWQTFKQYFPIPQTERNKNPNLTQNQGYN